MTPCASTAYAVSHLIQWQAVVMRLNRSAPPVSVTPVLVYPDVTDAVTWLCRVFGFVEHVRIGDHRAQLGFGDGAVIVADASHGRHPPSDLPGVTHSVLVRVDDVYAHHDKTRSAGAAVVSPPVDMPFGERQYSVTDPAGHHWTFTQSIADLAPENWGGESVNPW
jgi:uncharacterized glyoxalase superfamily protein PhnB